MFSRSTARATISKVGLACALFAAGIATGVLVVKPVTPGPTVPAEYSELPGEGLRSVMRPELPTLMSDDRSLTDVCYFLNDKNISRFVNTFQVFEAMVTDPNVKGPLLGFWTDENGFPYAGLRLFSIDLGTDLPRSLATTEIEKGHIMVVRYLARLRSTARGGYYLEHHTLLGYAVMSIDDAQRRPAPPADEEPPPRAGDEEELPPLPK